MAANILYGSKTRSTLHRHAALQAGAYVLFLARHLYEPWACKHYMSMELYPAINREHSALLSPICHVCLCRQAPSRQKCIMCMQVSPTNVTVVKPDGQTQAVLSLTTGNSTMLIQPTATSKGFITISQPLGPSARVNPTQKENSPAGRMSPAL